MTRGPPNPSACGPDKEVSSEVISVGLDTNDHIPQVISVDIISASTCLEVRGAQVKALEWVFRSR